MNANLTTKLKEEANKNEAFRAVCTVFAVRERARQQVTVAALSKVMHREGFEFSKDDLKAVLARLADFGVGKIDRDPKNRLRALKNISIRLQSVGKVAVEGSGPLIPFKPQVRFRNLPPIIETPVKPVKQQAKAPVAKKVVKPAPKAVSVKQPMITVSVVVGDERVQFEVPVNGLKLSK